MKQVSHTLRVALAIIFSLFALSILSVGAVAAFPPKCASCHVGKNAKVAISTTHSVHKNQSCVSCHAGKRVVERVSFGAQVMYSMMIPAFDSQNFDSTKGYDSRCKSCHSQLSGTITNNGISIDHTSCAANQSCASCHGSTGHTVSGSVSSTRYTMDKCFTCHSSLASSKSCTTCHTGRTTKEIQQTSAWKVTHGPNWKQTHGMGNLDTCSVCHSSSMCATCHGSGVPHPTGFFEDHGAYAQSKKANCTSCHKETYCTDCHGGFEMPHPKDFLKSHSSSANSMTDSKCTYCHSKSDCNDCHAKHVHPGGAKTSYQRAKGGQ